MTTAIATILPHQVSTRLWEDLAQWRLSIASGADPDDAFRYEMHARRLVAADLGREDAVAWALQWHEALLQEEQAQQALKNEASQEEADRLLRIRQEISAGKSGNPRFQAFLDTLEDPGSELYDDQGTFQGWKYLVWNGKTVT